MSSSLTPADWEVRHSIPFFTKENVPAALLSHHSTAVGVFDQLCVMEGTVTHYGSANERVTGPEEKVVIHAGQFAAGPPQYWHHAELNDDACFNIHSWVAEETDGGNGLFHAKKV